jgi:predicted  nucleic acid-binding Zn-ribbon protein
MEGKLDALRELHALDVKVLRLQARRDGIPAALCRLDEETQRVTNILKEAERKLTQNRSTTDRFDLEIRTIEAAIKKLEEQLGKASSNKEYNTFLSEIASKKADMSRLEDQALAALTSIDELVDEHRTAKQELHKARQLREREAATVEAAMDEVDRELAAMQTQRPALAEQVDPGLLSQYERIVAKRGETALVPVIDGACQGCFMRVTSEVANALVRAQDVILCKTCSRILYLP